jgi:hypothetical protein
MISGFHRQASSFIFGILIFILLLLRGICKKIKEFQKKEGFYESLGNISERGVFCDVGLSL